MIGAFSPKSLVRMLLGETICGELDFIRFPELGRAWGGSFNGQKGRQALFRDLIERLDPAAIVETGTYFGTTTELFAKIGVPVFTIENNARNYGFARARLRRHRNVTLRYGDSPAQLRSLFDGPLGSLGERSLYCYLDAHWNDDLPLLEELEIIFGRCQNAVVMIDDFQVPDDPGYVYDDYGVGKVLNAEYIAPVVDTQGLMVFYPAAPSDEETGEKAGSAILCKQAVHVEKLLASPFLRRAS